MIHFDLLLAKDHTVWFFAKLLDFPICPRVPLPSFIPLSLEKIFYKILILTLLELWSLTCGLLWKMFHVHLKKCSCIILNMSVGPKWSIVFKFCVSLLTLDLVVLSAFESKELQYPIIIELLTFSSFSSATTCFIYWRPLSLGTYTYNYYIFLMN